VRVVCVLLAGAGIGGCNVFDPPVPQCEAGAKSRVCDLDEPIGACLTGTQTCEAGFWSECMPSKGGGDEICDGLDNDCDGKVDEPEDADSSCKLDHVSKAECKAKKCEIVTCQKDYDDCDQTDKNGCEVSLVDNPDNCGACDEQCVWQCAGTACREVDEVSLGAAMTCALLTDRSVTCWGDNAKGQSGSAAAGTQVAPGEVELRDAVFGTEGAAAIAVGADHACGIAIDPGADSLTGGVACWGNNKDAQRGGSGKDETSVRRVTSLGSAFAVAAGPFHSCATASGDLDQSPKGFCWGLGSSGQLGNGGFATATTPVPWTFSQDDIKVVALGNTHTCALWPDDRVYCWGAAADGKLGNGVTENQSVAESLVLTVDDDELFAKHISAKREHTCAVQTTGKVMCWGNNDSGKLGIDSATASADYATPIAGSIPAASRVAAGAEHTCVLTTSGAVYCWGDSSLGQLGGPANKDGDWLPVQVPGISDGKAIAAGDNHTCVIGRDKALTCWGSNSKGQLGVDTGSKLFSAAPVEVAPVLMTAQ